MNEKWWKEKWEIAKHKRRNSDVVEDLKMKEFKKENNIIKDENETENERKRAKILKGRRVQLRRRGRKSYKES